MSRLLRFHRMAFAVLTIAGASALAADSFDAAPLDGLPAGWSPAKTVAGEGSEWKVLEDQTSPHGSKVLTQVSSSGPSGLFNLCVSRDPVFADVDLAVSLKPMSGTIDQGGGVVWHYQDSNNYYLARWNPLEGNFRLYKVVDGKRSQIGDTVRVDGSVGEWHSIHVLQCGPDISCFFDGTQYFDVSDETLPKTGRCGLWSKADAVTEFTAPQVSSLSAEPDRRMPNLRGLRFSDIAAK